MRNRRWIVLAAGLMLPAFAADAQAQDLEIGFKLGAAISNVSFDADFDAESITTFGGGGHLRLGLTPSISLQPELLFMRKGYKASELGTEFELNLDYAEIPVLLRIDVPMAAAIRPFVYAGPYGAFEVACKVEGEDCGDDDDRTTFDFGAVFGAGLGFAAGPGSFVVEGRYDLGLKNLVDDDDGDDALELKNRAFGLFIGYAVPLGR